MRRVAVSRNRAIQIDIYLLTYLLTYFVHRSAADHRDRADSDRSLLRCSDPHQRCLSRRRAAVSDRPRLAEVRVPRSSCRRGSELPQRRGPRKDAYRRDGDVQTQSTSSALVRRRGLATGDPWITRTHRGTRCSTRHSFSRHWARMVSK